MIADDQLISRRSFIRASTSCLAFSVGPLLAGRTSVKEKPSTEINLADCRAQLLELVNVERGLADVAAVALDEFTCQVESRHALDMATTRFLSHWGSNGLKPYQRYSLAGGTDYTQENVSATDHIPSQKSDRVTAEVVSMNFRMHEEKPPNDGHRRAILAADATHVGFGVALNQDSLRLAEMFVARYAEVEPFGRQARPRANLVIKGKLLNHEHLFQHADVFYEPPPETHPSRPVVRRQYSLPEEFMTLRPILGERMHYVDGTTGTIDLGSHGRFHVPLTLYKEQPGIYTVVVWIKRKQKDKAFPVTEICIRAE